MKMKSFLTICPALLIMVLFVGISCESTVGTEEIAGTQQSEVGILNIESIESGESVTLIAGKDEDVGEVEVSDNGTNLTVTFRTSGQWCLLETHLHVADDSEDIPTTKKGNPIPGKFDLSGTHECETEVKYSSISLSDLGSPLYVAAHAVVQKGAAPYYASSVVEANQGDKKDGTSVDAERSNPDNALEFETGEDVSNFFSLGFGGDITLAYECPISNGTGDDIRVIEDTWGLPYPLETADVYVSQNGDDWVLLGEADNTDLNEIHTQSFFDLEDIGWDWASYVKVVDTTDPGPHNNNADGYDLNAVEALHDCVDITEETAWGEGNRFVEKGNWGTYFEYTLD